ncbi:autotransporter outer membrane beta-barrel domain-containing protein [Sodalis sp. C49]|uniref:autotransporter outer membrane beta-barrel domain-containing protein n=1 Tax=Sodalis sp. C49 TaxID=3228929 RepID=UPI003965B33A
MDPANTVIGSSGTAVSLTNHTGGVIIGNIAFGPGNDRLTLEGGSTLTGNISGGEGANALVLNSVAGSPPAADLLSGDITDFQTLTKNGDGEWRLTGNIKNTGSAAPLIVNVNNGILTLTGENTYTGDTVIHGATLVAGGANAFSSRSAYTVAPAGTMNLQGFNQTIASMNNAGTINLNGDGGTVLNVTGDYAGNNGRLNFNARLSDDATKTERLIIGGNTSGTTLVSVNNAGGGGGATVDGIELISVNGVSDGEFLQSGRIVAGAYDYTLTRGAGTDAANWYLHSSVEDPNPGPGPSPEPVPTPEPGRVERPEAGSYTANLAAANTLFANRLDNRQGMAHYTDALTGEDKSTSLWLINEGGHNRSRDDGGQLRTQSNRYVLQLGGDIGQWSSSSLDSIRLGVMAGYGNAKSNTGSRVSGYSANSAVDGYSLGIYATWYANAMDKTGLYIDGWTQYGWFNNRVSGQDLNEEEYKSKGASASLESGYAVKFGENAAKNTTYYVQPQVQAIWMGVKADDHTEANGTRVSGEGDGNIQTRLGVKAYMHTYSERDNDKDRAFQPYVEANWIHNSDDFGVSMDGITVSQDGAANIAELKLGVEGQINRNVNLWGNVAQQVGNRGYSDTTGIVGVKYRF